MATKYKLNPLIRIQGEFPLFLNFLKGLSYYFVQFGSTQPFMSLWNVKTKFIIICCCRKGSSGLSYALPRTQYLSPLYFSRANPFEKKVPLVKLLASLNLSMIFLCIL